VTIRGTLALVAGLVIGLFTGWPVGGILAAAAAWWLPPLLGKDHEHERELARIEAIAAWTEQLRDTLGAAAGLQQAILATSTTAPEPIRPDVVALCVDITGGTTLPVALRTFADRLADPTGDLVVAALLQATTGQARQLADLLAALAQSARAQASMRLRVTASRARVRSSARMIICVTLIVAAALVLFNRSYLTPYSTVTGQFVLLAVGAVFAIAFAWLARSGRVERPPRIFGPPQAADIADEEVPL
jgi:Flp pilus assembly protein TadB